MKQLLLAAMMAFGLGLGLASAHAATMSHSNRPQVSHWGPAYGDDSGSEP